MPEAQALEGLTIIRSKFLERRLNPWKDLLAVIELYSFIKKNQIEIVHNHSSKAGVVGRLAAKLAKVKIILHTVHGWPFHDFQPFYLRLFFIWLERKAANYTNKIIVVSNHDRKLGPKYKIGEASKYALIPYGIDFAEFQHQSRGLRKELGINEEELLIGTVSCFKPQKSLDDFIRMADLVVRSFPAAKFLLVGEGALRGRIERLIRRLNLENKIILAGWRRDIPQILSAIDIFVLTSLWEGLPISALEAMAAAKPIVATNTGGIEDVITDGENGFLVPCRNIQQMSERVVVLLKDAVLRQKIGEHARSSISQRLSAQEAARQIEGLYFR